MFNPSNKIISYLINGWQFPGISRYASGTPLSFTATCELPQAVTTSSPAPVRKRKYRHYKLGHRHGR